MPHTKFIYARLDAALKKEPKKRDVTLGTLQATKRREGGR